jgi:hypothetical protein
MNTVIFKFLVTDNTWFALLKNVISVIKVINVGNVLNLKVFNSQSRDSIHLNQCSKRENLMILVMTKITRESASKSKIYDIILIIKYGSLEYSSRQKTTHSSSQTKMDLFLRVK